MKFTFFIPFLFLFSSLISVAQTDGDKNGTANTQPGTTISVQKITETIYMLKGKGGNIGLNIGNDGVLMIDSQFGDVTPEILNIVKDRTNKPIQFLVNTHHHGDHTGGNKNLINTGTLIYAHDNAYKNIFKKVTEAAEKKYQEDLDRNTTKSKEDGRGDGAAQEAKKNTKELEQYLDKDAFYNMITFSEDMTFHYNGETIMVFHVHNAHTDGDVMVYFADSNVLHTGDVFFNGKYPFIDTNNGGSLDGCINALQKALMVIDEDTKIIPGHGDIGTMADLRYSHSMLKTLSQRVAYEFIAKKTEGQILANKQLTADFDRQGYGDGFISSERILKVMYDAAKEKYNKDAIKK